MDYQRGQHTVYLINYHLVWIPRRRKPVLVSRVAQRLKEIIKEVAKENHWTISALEVLPDHVHLFVSADPNHAIRSIVRAFKGRSARILRKEFSELMKLPSMWTHSYFVSTTGNVSSETINRYIQEQKKV